MTYDQLPKDPAMLLSFVNTQLRDFYPTLDEFCLSFHISKKELADRLLSIDYSYDEGQNQFI